MPAARSSDPAKPLTSPAKDGGITSWTKLEIEHRVPAAGLGGNDRRNLAVACFWCNQGKSVFQSSTEALFGLRAHAFSALSDGGDSWGVRNRQRSFFVALSRSRRCSRCQKGPREAELTIRGTGAYWI